jgi:hypothetical protein
MRALFAIAWVMTWMLSGCAQHPEFDGSPPAAAPTAETAAPRSVGTPVALSADAVVYLPPPGGSGGYPSEAFAARRVEVVKAIAEEASAKRLEVTHQDSAQGFVVARYEGPVREYLDCGTYSAPASAFSVPAGGSGLTRSAMPASGAAKVNQDMRLNVRLVALVESQGPAAANAHVEGQYVLRRELVFMDTAGRELRRYREFIDLTSAERAKFEDGTACFATGTLERSILPKRENQFGS